ncbi:MAG: ribonuclease G [Brachymonas sp.]|nr:ribonuclease G [Brachymonas sp.]
MQQEILINWSPQEARAAVVEQGVVQEVHIERALQRGLVGNIYLGKVMRVLPGMQSAFVDIGLDRSAFLHVADVPQPAAAPSAVGEEPPPPKPIEHMVFEGQTLMVQVIKDPLGSKGARLSAQISIAGRMLVLLPQGDGVGVSQKIDLEQREAIRQRVLDVLAAQRTSGQGLPACGYIVRTNAEDASEAELLRDMQYLHTTWAGIKDASLRQAAPALLHQDLNLLQRVLRDMVDECVQSIRIDSREQHAALLEFAQTYMPDTVARIEHYAGERPIFDLFAIDEEITRALGSRVGLKSGGYLVIDQTEALTTIDVNTGGFVGARNFDETIFKTNLEAAQAIARQLRLRNLGGIIIVDFIDMSLPEHQQAVLAELHKQLQRDRIKTVVGEFSSLGLLEMTRKRTRESLARVLCEPCAACGGRGRLKTARSVVYDILREVLREARQFNPQEIRVIAAPAVIDLLLDEESQHLAALGEFIAKPIALRADSSLSQEQYDIVLF